MKLIIDRFEGNYAVCEDETQNIVNIKLDEIPSGAKEGTVLIYDNGYLIDEAETEERAQRIKSKMDKLWE